MPRQPLLKVLPNPNLGDVSFGRMAADKRPRLAKAIADCVMFWPTVEAHMAMLLGHILGSHNEAVLATFQVLRRSSAQRDAINEAGRVSLNERDNELLTAILNVHKSTESERNAIVHGQFGMCEVLPHALLWISTTDYICLVSSAVLGGTTTWKNDEAKKLLASMYVYKREDLEKIFSDFHELADQWHHFRLYLAQGNTKKASELYRQLCDRPRISQELAKLRQKNNPLTPPQPPQRPRDV